MAVEGKEFIRVDCHADHRGELLPLRFHLGARSVEVAEDWLAPDHRYFKIKGADGGTYILRHDPANERWALVLYRR